VRFQPTVLPAQRFRRVATLDFHSTPTPTKETARWLAVTAVRAREPDAIIPPTIACRLGGYKIKFFGAEPLPFTPQTLTGMYGNFEGYKNCVEEVVTDPEAARLYDPRVESAEDTAESSRAPFNP
jgi:hypothetical protein